jgi:2-hydroxychromene-2-carboxylate isomerase
VAAPIVFWFDFISPYAYIAWTQIHALAERHGREVQPVPILFAALLDANATKGPAEIPDKRVWVFKDTLRHAHRLGIPLAPPPSHPFNPLLALRVASLPMDSALRRRVIDALFAATWGGGPGVTDPEVVAGLVEAAGLPGADAIAQASSAEGKARVKDATAAAQAKRVFGVPSMFVDDELFWGFDSFVHVEQRLRGEDPITPELLQRYVSVRPSAQRPAGQR